MRALNLNDQMHQAFLEATRTIAAVVPNGAHDIIGDWLVYDAAVDNVDFNTAAVSGDPLKAARQIERMEQWYAARRAEPCLKLRQGPDDPVIEALGARYHEAPRREPYMGLALANMPEVRSNGLKVEPVRDSDGVAAYDSFDNARGRPQEWSIAADVLDLPGYELWLGWLDGRVAARAMSAATRPVATIHNVFVAEDLRRRGFGAAITVAAMRACAEAGATYACLGSSRMGYPMYLSMGFEHQYDLAAFTKAG